MGTLTQTPRVLLLDDDSSVVDALSGILASLGYKIVKNTDPFRAIEDLESNPKGIHLIITDHEMPGINGSELVKRLRTLKIQIPVMLITGTIERVKDTTLFAAVFEKPFQLDEFIEACQKIVESEIARLNPSKKSSADAKEFPGKTALNKLLK